MNTLTTFLIIANGFSLLIIFLQVGTIKRLVKTLRDSKDLLQLYDVLLNLRKKKENSNSNKKASYPMIKV